MAPSVHSKAACVAALFLMSACLLPAVKADIRAVNRCPYTLTIFWESDGSGRSQTILPAGQDAQLGLPSPWVGGVMWGSPHANTDNGQCSQLEFNIASPDSPTRDFYDISIFNGYNEPVMINVTFLANGDTRNNLECGSPQCIIPNISTVCQLDNYYAGPDHACINADGPGPVDTPSIDLFRNACLEAYVGPSYDNTNVLYACNTGSNYDAIWCP